VTMFSQEEGFSQTTDSLERVPQTTEAFERLPRAFDRRSVVSERRQHILQQKQTDALPSLSPDTSLSRIDMRKIAPLREENRRLRGELDAFRIQNQVLSEENARLKQSFESEIAVIHDGYQHEITHYQNHLQEAISEHNLLMNEHTLLSESFADLTQNFQQTLDEEVTKRTQTLKLEGMSESASPFSEDTIPLPETDVTLSSSDARERALSEARYLKREAQRVVLLLEKERQELNAERQQVMALQYSIREQAQLRQKTLTGRLQARWKFATIMTSLSLLVLLVVLQFVCLSLLHFSSVTLAILLPIVVCALLTYALTFPLTMLKHLYLSLPRQKKVL